MSARDVIEESVLATAWQMRNRPKDRADAILAALTAAGMVVEDGARVKAMEDLLQAVTAMQFDGHQLSPEALEALRAIDCTPAPPGDAA